MRLAAQRCNVGGDVGGPARRPAFIADMDDRHRRLVRHARDAAGHIMVDHDIADHEDAAPGELCNLVLGGAHAVAASHLAGWPLTVSSECFRRRQAAFASQDRRRESRELF